MAHNGRRFLARLVMAGLLLVPPAGVAVAGEPEPRDILAPTGTLRVGLYTGTPTSILPDPKVGGPKGVGYDLGKALAEKLGVPYEPVVFSRNAEVLEAVKTGKVDAAFTNASPARAKVMDFGPYYLESELGYLVQQGSAVARLADVDVAGRRVGVTEGSSSDAALSHDLKQAEIVRVATVTLAGEMLAAGELDVFATNKATLYELAEKAPGSKVLDGQWGVERHAIAIPKGREQGLAFVRQFTEQAKAQGVVTAAIARSGLRAATTAAAQP
ncbi:MAG: transporter substrate-binding protein [Tardiphaga sp.]|uniref:transporter substrate-binding domain-containing protein n=1 Tax=Tardiphaga sp. TaxID=1926292 RepID=UPI002617DBF0|nr:transporter substrate-binding domain-containing protein [Tardiphaga sp.]MDB5503159.1 transporter substrate-binding protein [Tardiphaga sp.]